LGWTNLGDENPYWSVSTNEAYDKSKITDQAREEFFSSGREYANLIESYESLANISINRGCCFELGCGVGRITKFLSKIFDKVIAADISKGNIEICKDYLDSQGITNVELVLIDNLTDYSKISNFDFFYSFITLQHNSPPIQKILLELLTSKINSGGGCLFQTPSFISGYQFKIEDYLSEKYVTDLEMHALPMVEVLKILRQNNLTIQTVIPDQFTGLPGSFTYFASKE
jgi:2-polyprenyl-3-methyl-5-hydroxy-6-metoxy-1,4-benzoquinol methylase